MGQFVDHWDQARCLKLCVCVCVCVSVFTQHVLPQPALYYLRSDGICASQSIFWESWVGMFVNWAPFKTSTLGLMLQSQNYVFSLQPGKKKFDLSRSKTHFFYSVFFPTCRHELSLLITIKHLIYSTFVL